MEDRYRLDKHPMTHMTHGEFGMWLFLASEIMLFSGFYFVFFTYFQNQTNWASLSWGLPHIEAALILFVLLISNLLLSRYPKIAFIVILLGLLIKAHGIFPLDRASVAANIFSSLYFAFSFTHFLHMLGGFIALGILVREKKIGSQKLKPFIMYWTFVDGLWISILLAFHVLPII